VLSVTSTVLKLWQMILNALPVLRATEDLLESGGKSGNRLALHQTLNPALTRLLMMKKSAYMRKKSAYKRIRMKAEMNWT
jgi:hypothetical protein